MTNLKEINLEAEVREMANEFCGYQDTNAICNIIIDGRTVQVSIVLTDEDESDFNEYVGIPLFVLD